MRTTGPFLFRKEPLQTCQSFGLRTAKCLTTPVQEKKPKLMLWQEPMWHWGPHSPRAQEMLLADAQSQAGMQQRVLHGQEEDLHDCAVVPWDQKQTPARGMQCHVLLLPLQYAHSVSATSISF